MKMIFFRLLSFLAVIDLASGTGGAGWYLAATDTESCNNVCAEKSTEPCNMSPPLELTQSNTGDVLEDYLGVTCSFVSGFGLPVIYDFGGGKVNCYFFDTDNYSTPPTCSTTGVAGNQLICCCATDPDDCPFPTAAPTSSPTASPTLACDNVCGFNDGGVPMKRNSVFRGCRQTCVLPLFVSVSELLGWECGVCSEE